MSRNTLPGALIAVGLLATACGSDDSAEDESGASTVPIEASTAAVPEGMTVVVDGLDRPTQIADGPEGVLIVAQLAGNENAATGQVLAVDVTTGEQQILLEDLDKPTGVLWRDGVLWAMVKRGLVRAEWNAGATDVGPVEVVLDDLPFNGRSEGSLTPLPDGRFLYETSAMVEGEAVADGSATLWAFDPATRTSTAVATGTSGAYAHAVLPDGRIVTTEVSDAFFGTPPVDEVNVVALTDGVADLGFPDCPGEQDCAGIVRPTALFDRAATPVGVAVVGGDVFVSLLVTGEVVRLPLATWTAGGPPVESEVVHDGLDAPLGLLARPDGSIWLSEHNTGRILGITP